MTTLRSPASDWISLAVLAACQLTLAVVSWTTPGRAEWIAWVWLVVGVTALTMALRVAVLRVDLSDGAVTVRGLRRRTVEVAQIEAIVARRRWFTGPVVELVPVDGRPVELRVHRSFLTADAFDRDAQVIDRWWQAHAPAGAAAPVGHP